MLQLFLGCSRCCYCRFHFNKTIWLRNFLRYLKTLGSLRKCLRITPWIPPWKIYFWNKYTLRIEEYVFENRNCMQTIISNNVGLFEKSKEQMCWQQAWIFTLHCIGILNLKVEVIISKILDLLEVKLWPIKNVFQ